MSRIIFSLLIFCLLASCQIENLDQKKKEFAQKRAKEKREQRQLEKQRLKEAQVDLLPALSTLTKLKSTNCGMINMVNGLPLDLANPMPIRNDQLTFKGFAYDKKAMKLAGGAIIKIDEIEFEVSEWTARRKFAEKKGEELLMTGFTYTINSSSLEPGIHTVNLYVVTSDKKQYYDSKRQFEIELLRD